MPPLDDETGSESLQRLAKYVVADGLVCSLKHGGECLHIFQEDDRGHCYYEVIPWRADPRVPVLYFSVYVEDDEGTVKVASADSVRAMAKEMGKWITPTEHPFTALPVMFIHPCHTQDWLEDTGGDWHLWLQHFGRPVGLRI